MHGYELDSRSLIPLIEPYFKNSNNFQRIYIDLPEMGKSRSTLFSSSDHTLFLVQQLINTFNFSSFSIVSQSYGSYISLGLNKLFKKEITSQLFIAPMIIPNKHQRNVSKIHNKYVSPNQRNFTTDFFKINVINNYIKFKLYQKTITDILKINNSNNLVQIANSEKYSFTFNIFENSDIKTHILVGCLDNIVGYTDIKKITKFYKNTKYVMYKNSGHNLIIDEYDKFLIDFDNFLHETLDIKKD